MPNWCANSTTLVFPTSEEAQEFKDHITAMEADEEAKDENGNSLSLLGFFVPEPKYDNEGDWYWWRVNNWGTKWDVSLHNIDWVDDVNCVMNFDTAWSPPTTAYDAMCEQGLNVYATYHEPGMCFVGAWEDGNDEYYDYSSIDDPEEVRDYIGEHLDDEYGISEWMREWQAEEEEVVIHVEESDSGVENFGQSMDYLV